MPVVYRRNYAHFEGRRVNVKDLFQTMMERDIQMICKYGGKGKKELFCENGFVYEGREGEILFKWE